jgi:hypothetical protein
MKEGRERNLFLTLWSYQVPESGRAAILQFAEKYTRQSTFWTCLG